VTKQIASLEEKVLITKEIFLLFDTGLINILTLFICVFIGDGQQTPLMHLSSKCH
jgi:hypothetical protein